MPFKAGILPLLVLAGILGAPLWSQDADALPFKESRGLLILEEIQEAIARLAEHVTPTVVGVSTVKTPARPGSLSRRGGLRIPGSGSGIVIHEDGYIVTNNHVIGRGEEVEIHFSDQSTLSADIVGRDPDTDLALLKVHPGRKLPSAGFGDSGAVKIGQWVLAVGNPFGLDQTVTLGVVSGIGRDNMNLSRYENFIQTDAPINPGNSGGPLFNLRGEVIGINTAIINFAQGIGFAIPSDMASRVVRQLKTGGKVVRGWLGVGIQPVPPALAEQSGLPEGRGILVSDVFANDPADRAGIKSGDIMTRLGDEPLTSVSQFSRVVAGFAPGDEVLAHVIRDGQPHRFRVAMGSKKSAPSVDTLPLTAADVDLGIDVSPVTEELARRFSLGQHTGVIVVDVAGGSVAHTEGVRKGDMIQEVNRVAVPTMETFRRAVEAINRGETVLLKILRQSRAFFVVLQPGR